MRLFLISNMYPSKSDKLFGVFVKNLKKEFVKQDVVMAHEALIKGRTESKLRKLIKYTKHYIRIMLCFFKSDYDLIYVHYFSHHVPILWVLLPFKRKPLVINAHGTDIQDMLNTQNLHFFARRVLKKIDLLVVPSGNHIEVLTQRYKDLNREKLFVSPSGGLDLENLKPLKETHKKDFTLGFVSRFEEGKGWKVFLEALIILQQKNLKFKALIIGKGTDEQKIKRMVKENGLEEQVELIGFVPQDKLKRYYNAMDGYVFPSFREGLGLTGLEAMACGTPVIASAIPGLKSYVKEGENGFLFEPGNEEDLAEKIQTFKALSNEKIKSLQESGIKTAGKFERSVVAENLIKRLEELN